ncbi:ABC transporter ATP-binding protein [Alkalicoccobacillus murimartini]|uniref:ABC-2 type transport system ATP-binding protein n=1 Tax=Alkalicoccobacillus murimartini TaxID=171685 RepID=A0ABT9YGV2_9BACI|nr:ABC transporter ATP-binding protein [Alkalicoccobacillus murimartini]MDQ0207098.1 ABC-2 type transport system ATP-binding protein [Alkalicoccobacillus murimartini]
MSLSIDHVTKQFGQHKAVNDLTIQVPKGEMFGMLGANGAGKTTTFRMMLGLLEPSEGKITWDQKKIDYSRTSLIGYLPEERGLYPKLTVKEQLLYLGRLKGMKKADILTAMTEWLEKFKVPEYATKKIEELSKGNQQKIQFIAAVLHRPELIILDEPFSGLDPLNVDILKKAVMDLKNEGATIVFSSHRMEHVEELCEHLCIMHKGHPVVHGKLKEIKQDYGKKNVLIRADYSLDFLKDQPGVTKYDSLANGARIQVEGLDIAKRIFSIISEKGFVERFEVEEPSLHDIFVEKVGTSYE